MTGVSSKPRSEGEVLSRHIPGAVDALALFRKVTQGGLAPHTLLLESGDTSTRSGEKSLVVARSALHILCEKQSVTLRALNRNGMAALGRLRKALEAKARIQEAGEVLTCDFPLPPKGNEEQRLRAPSPVDALRATLRALTPTAVGEAALLPVVVGVFGYDFLDTFETLPDAARDDHGWPDYEFWLPDELVWVNHVTRSITVVSHVWGGDEASLLHNDARLAVALLARAVEEVAQSPRLPTGKPVPEAPRPDLNDEEFAALVEKAKGHIVAGDVFQMVPSRSFTLPCPDPVSAFARLRETNPSPYMFFVNGSQGILFGASPETALRYVAASGTVSIFPIAGTRSRGRDAEGRYDEDLDGRLEAELRLDTKELAEHMMLVDLARNDIARVSIPGSRRVADLCRVVRYSHVMHLVSRVEGKLRDSLDALHAYLATMNMGTLVGAPKLKAAELLRRYEPGKRGPYGGAVAYMNGAGDFDSGIVIRSALVQKGRAHVRAGAGVVHDSRPDLEAQETARKAQAVLAAIAASGGVA